MHSFAAFSQRKIIKNREASKKDFPVLFLFCEAVLALKIVVLVLFVVFIFVLVVIIAEVV